MSAIPDLIPASPPVGLIPASPPVGQIPASPPVGPIAAKPAGEAPRPAWRPARAGRRTIIPPSRRPPSARWLARRNRSIRLAKFILPGLALALLAALVAWPHLAGVSGDARLAFQAALPGVHGDTVYGARYHGVDEQNRPYTLTAAIARRITEARIDLTDPAGDLLLAPGMAVTVEAKRGVYRDPSHELDLSRDVTLYRTDGTVLMTSSAAIDLHRGSAAGSAPVRATGPFGTLHAQGGFTLLDRGGSILFAGPARLVLNGAGS